MTDQEVIELLRYYPSVFGVNRKTMDYVIKAIEDRAKLKEAVGKIRERVQYASSVCGYINFSNEELLEIIDRNTEGLL